MHDSGDDEEDRPSQGRALQHGLFVLLVSFSLINVHLFVRVDGLSDRLSTTARRLQGLERVETADVESLRASVRQLTQHLPTEQDMLLCRRRTQCLRDTFETLIGVWPGRARVPEPCGDWPNWPHPGAMVQE